MSKRSINLAKEIERREYQNKLSPFPVYDTEVIDDYKFLMMITKKENYNHVPVEYCKVCLSLQIKEVTFTKGNDIKMDQPPAEVVYCGSCSGTEVEKCHITEWIDLYHEKYGEDFLTGEKDERA